VSGRAGFRVFVTRRLPERVRAKLDELFELDLHDSDWPPPRAELLERVAGAAGLVTTLGDRVDEELLDAAGDTLRVVANYAVGFDNIDLDAASRRGLVVSITPDVLTHTTAEHTLALTLALVRRVAEGDRFLRRREAWSWAPTFMLGSGLQGRTFGCVGYGRIGREAGRLSETVGMRVVHTRRTGGMPLPDLLAESDVVSIHCPLTAETHHLIDADALAQMRPHAVLVNTARGPIVDERALVGALQEGRIAGAALDVFEYEPEVADELLDLENVVLTPHLGSATVATREAMGRICIDALRAVLIERRRPATAVA
jgi:glyoxylate reductase